MMRADFALEPQQLAMQEEDISTLYARQGTSVLRHAMHRRRELRPSRQVNSKDGDAHSIAARRESQGHFIAYWPRQQKSTYGRPHFATLATLHSHAEVPAEVSEEVDSCQIFGRIMQLLPLLHMTRYR